MSKRWVSIAAGVWSACYAGGAVITTVDLVDATDGLDLPPAGMVCVDVMVDLTTPGDEWTAAGMRADAFNGGSFFYRVGTNGQPNLRNPNSGDPTGKRTIFATSVSSPAARSDSDGRFAFSDVRLAGSYTGPPPPTTTGTRVNVAWFRNPDGRVDVDGAVARVAINLPDGINQDGLLLTSGTATPPASHPLVLVRSRGPDTPTGHDFGTVNASVLSPGFRGIDWVLSAVPEPSSFALLALGALAAVRHG